MSEHDEKSPPRRSKFRPLRFLLLTLGGLVILLALAWIFFEQYLRIETYRPALEAQIEEITGLPVTVGELDLTLRPLPVIQVNTLAIGRDDFRLEAAQAAVEPLLQELLHRNLRITAIDLTKLKIVVPRDPAVLRSSLKAIAERMGKHKGGNIRFSVDRIHAKHATLFLGTAEKPIFTGDLDLHDVLSPTPSGRIDAAVIAMKDEVSGSGDIHLRRGPGGKGIDAFQGSFSMEGLQVANVVENRKAPRVTIEVDGAFSGSDHRNLTVNLSGDVEPTVGAEQLGESLEGPFTAKAVWDGSTVRLEDVRWEAAGLELAGDIARTEDGAYRASIPSATVGQYTLDPLFALLPAGGIRLDAEKGASVGLENLAVSVYPGGDLRLNQGRVTAVGVNLLNKEKKRIAQNIKGVLLFEDGTVRVEGLEGGGLELTGTVIPDFKAKTAKVDLSGTFALSRDALKPVVSVERIRDVGGALKLERIAGTFGSGKGMPKDFVLEGSTEDANITLDTQTFDAALKPVSAKFSTEGKVVKVTARAQSETLGTLEAVGNYTFESRAWEGTFTTDLPQAVTPFLKKEGARKTVPPLLQAYGRSTFNVTASLPTETRKSIPIRLARQGEPSLEGELEFLPKKGGGYALGPVVAKTILPLSAAAEILPPNVQAEGNAAIAFTRSVQENAFRADIGLANATVSYGDYLRKREDLPATVVVTGEASEKRWAARALAVTVAEQTVQGVWQEGRLVFPDLNLDAAKLSTLMRGDAQATGVIRGRAATGPTEADVVLQDVAYTFKPEVSVESVNGRLTYANGRLASDNLAVRGANSSANVAFVREDGAWQGTVRAQQLDINRILELQKAARGESGAKPAEGQQPKEGGGFKGHIELHADRLLYRRAELANVSADITGEGNRIVIRDAVLHPAEGQATAAVVAAREAAGSPWVLEGQAKLEDASASLLDSLIFKEPRGFTGKVNGNVEFRIPLVPNTPTVNKTSATATLTARDGSFGKMGLATKILNVLRTTELLRLRLPSVSDQGLTYDTAKADISMVEGVMQVKKVDVERPSFALRASGVVDFPKDDMRINVQVHPFETVTGLAEKVPIVGNVVGGLKGLNPVGIVVRGSPYDPSVTPGSVFGGERVEASSEEPAEEEAATAEPPADEMPTEQAHATPAPEPDSLDQDGGLGLGKIVRDIFRR